MPSSKAPVQQVNGHKMKGSKIIGPPWHPAVGGWLSGKRCRFFELPTELRIRIYELILEPFGTILFRKWQDNARSAQVDRGMAQRSLQPMKPAVAALPVRLRDREMGTVFGSIPGILLTSRRTYHEATRILYEQTVFHFAKFHLARCFLQVVSRPNCESIRKLQLYHRTWKNGSSSPGEKIEKQKANASFVRLCRQFVTGLPNVVSLDIAVAFHEEFYGDRNRIVPDYSNATDTIIVDPGVLGGQPEQPERLRSFRPWQQINKLGFMQALRAFAAWRKLTEVKVEVTDMPDDTLETVFMLHSSYTEVTPHGYEDQIQARWIDFRHSLYTKLGEAVRRLIMGLEGHEVWDEYMADLEEYRAFCYNKLAPTAQTLADPKYAEWWAGVKDGTVWW